MGGSKKVTIGYEYRMGVHLALCHGPVNAIVEINSDGKNAWTGYSSGGVVTVDAPDLFGGQKREGGYAGDVEVCNGQLTAPARSYLEGFLSGFVPLYKGLTSLVFKSFYWTAMSPYIKPPEIVVDRTTAGWNTNGGVAWYAAKCAIGFDMNPAHIIYQCLTDPVWGLGYPISTIDTTSFTAVADTLHSEGFGLSLPWFESGTINDFVQLVLDHVGGVLRQDRATGKWTLKLLRADYSVGALLELNKNNCRVESFGRAAWGEIVNEVVVQYRDYHDNPKTITVQDLGSIEAQGAVISQEVDYPGIRSDALAARVAARDLQRYASPLAQATITASRVAHALNVGDVFALTWDQYGVSALPMRIVKIDKGSLTEGSIKIEAVEDIFGMPTGSYVEQQPSGAVNPVNVPTAVADAKLVEWPYYDAVRTLSAADFGVLDPDFGFAHFLAGAPTLDAINFDLRYSPNDVTYSDAGTGDFNPTARLAASMALTATPVAVTLNSRKFVDLVEVGDYAYIDNEILRVDAIDATAGTATLARGCLDTVPTLHSSNALVLFVGEYGAVDRTERIVSETAYYKPLTRTSRGLLDESLATDLTITFDNRAQRPYPPGRVRMNGNAYPTYISGNLTVSWAHRDRLQQTVSVVDTDEVSIGPEVGTTYELDFYGEGDVLLRSVTGVTGTSYAYADEVADAGYLQSRLRVVLRSRRDGLASWQEHSITVQRKGWGFNWGNNWGGN